MPVSDTDITDANGNAQVKDSEGNLYNINVATELEGNIEGAEVKIADGKITVTLPDGTVINYADRTTVTVTDKDNAPVKDMSVNVKDSNGGDRTGTTDADGKVVVPPLSEDMTDKDGNAQIKDENGNMYNVNVSTETKGNIEGAEVKIADGKITVTLPDGTVIDYYLKRKATGKAQAYNRKVMPKYQAEIAERKAAIRAEDIEKGVFIPVNSLPKLEPRKGV